MFQFFHLFFFFVQYCNLIIIFVQEQKSRKFWYKKIIRDHFIELEIYLHYKIMWLNNLCEKILSWKAPRFEKSANYLISIKSFGLYKLTNKFMYEEKKVCGNKCYNMSEKYVEQLTIKLHLFNYMKWLKFIFKADIEIIAICLKSFLKSR